MNYTIDNLFNSLVHGVIDDCKTGNIYGQSKTQIKDDAYYVYIPIPGLTKDDLKIIVKENYLNIMHETKADESDIPKFMSHFEKLYRLPKDSNVDKIDAQVKNGICTIKIPKDKEKSGEKTIAIK